MAYIKEVEISSGIGSNTYLIEPILYSITSGTTSAFTASIDNFELITGATVTLKINANNVANVTLKINNTEAKNIRYNNANIAANALKANRFYSFVYDGTYWQLIGELDTNTTYTAENGISLSGTTFSNSGVRSISTGTVNGAISVNTNGSTSTIYLHGLEDGYINTHKENNGLIIPFIENDIAFLEKRGGSYQCYVTTDTDYTAETLTSTATINMTALFNGKPNYNAVGRQYTDVVVIDITCPSSMPWTQIFYIDFGATTWRAKKIRVLVKNNNDEITYTLKGTTDNNSSGHYKCNVSHRNGTGFNQIRIVLTDWANQTNTDHRIAQIGVVSYSNQDAAMTLMSRGEDDQIWRSITPAANNTYSLGSSSNKWSNVYATNLYGSGANITSLNASNISNGTLSVDRLPTIPQAKLPVTLTSARLISTEQMAFSSWKPTYLVSGNATRVPAKTMALYADGIAITNPATNNDAGWLRLVGTSESDTVLELATSDDAGASNFETIAVRQYNTSTLKYEAILLGKINDVYGATSFPVQVSAPKFIGSLVGNADTATAFSANKSITLTGDVTGSASSTGGWSISTKANYLSNKGRLTSANIVSTDYLSKCFVFLASSNMSEGKPRADGIITHFSWDNSLWAGQLYIPANKTGAMQWRGSSDATDGTNWGNWVTLLDSSNYINYLHNGIDSTSTTLAATANSALIAAKKVASSNNTSKLYLVGATSQSATGVDSYSYQYTYTNNGLLSALKVGLNLNGTEKAHLEWNNTDQSIDFIFE